MSDSAAEIERNEEVNKENELLNDDEWSGWLPVEKVVNEHVIFLYEGKYYPGKILRVTKTKGTISSMEIASGYYCSRGKLLLTGQLLVPVPYGNSKSLEVAKSVTFDISNLVIMLKDISLHINDRSLKNRVLRIVKRLDKTSLDEISSMDEEFMDSDLAT
ncbi:hypothetical protein KPH14_002681 [Odynerus spinipes]|uniref:Uncharacterized protein n=1 Tax=Odynerus spinipes TaxID=1348599 RepID=A0AAD9R8S1_9HYME|nr:hypothetical protein KPH14_002681 [Odynerus spinipes]